jgi:hypothetical protein
MSGRSVNLVRNLNVIPDTSDRAKAAVRRIGLRSNGATFGPKLDHPVTHHLRSPGSECPPGSDGPSVAQSRGCPAASRVRGMLTPGLKHKPRFYMEFP